MAFDMLLNLARLPPDILCTLIIMSGEDAEEAVKLISRQWYSVIPVNRADLPIIHWFCRHVDCFEDTNLYMHIADENRKFFGVTKWSKMSFEPENIHCRFVKDRTSRKANTEKKARFYARIERLLEKCSRIGKLELRVNLRTDGAEINVVKNVVKGIEIDELHLRGIHTLNDETV